jgi:hypothetical protein
VTDQSQTRVRARSSGAKFVSVSRFCGEVPDNPRTP